MSSDTSNGGARCVQCAVAEPAAPVTTRAEGVAFHLAHPVRRQVARLLLLLGLAWLAPASAAPLEGDLGDGLRYYRATELPADLPPPPSGKPAALVFDLRYAAADETAATALDAWLKFRATRTAPVFVLVNHQTAPALRPVLAAQKSNPGLLTIGTTEPELAPDIAVAVKPDAERRAYDAAQNGTPLATLVAPPLEKPRSDEASLIRDRAHLPEEDADTDDELDLTDEPPPTHAAQPAAPPVDVALQRAVQIHRGLRALKRL